MTIKEEIQRLLDNADEYKLDIVRTFLHNSQKEPTLHDKLVEYGFGTTNGEYLKGDVWVMDNPDRETAFSRSQMLISYKKHEDGLLIHHYILTNKDDHSKIFNAIKLFEKWSKE